VRFLVPVGGVVDAYGILTSYKHKGVPAGIVAGLPWAGDNCAFTGFDADRFGAWLEGMTAYRSTCLFVAVPDVVGDAAATLARYVTWAQAMDGWPLAYVGQDGSEDYDIPPSASALFIGGTTAWKESQAAIDMIRRAQARGLRIHIGRVSWNRRYRMFRVLDGSELFTADGNRQRFEGVKKTLIAWKGYEDQPPLIQLGATYGTNRKDD
jgi:hypothetical protein